MARRFFVFCCILTVESDLRRNLLQIALNFIALIASIKLTFLLCLWAEAEFTIKIQKQAKSDKNQHKEKIRVTAWVTWISYVCLLFAYQTYFTSSKKQHANARKHPSAPENTKRALPLGNALQNCVLHLSLMLLSYHDFFYLQSWDTHIYAGAKVALCHSHAMHIKVYRHHSGCAVDVIHTSIMLEYQAHSLDDALFFIAWCHITKMIY